MKLRRFMLSQYMCPCRIGKGCVMRDHSLTACCVVDRPISRRRRCSRNLHYDGGQNQPFSSAALSISALRPVAVCGRDGIEARLRQDQGGSSVIVLAPTEKSFTCPNHPTRVHFALIGHSTHRTRIDRLDGFVPATPQLALPPFLPAGLTLAVAFNLNKFLQTLTH